MDAAEYPNQLRHASGWRLTNRSASSIRRQTLVYIDSDTIERPIVDISLASTFRKEALMPLVRIDLLEGKSPEFRERLGQIVYGAMLDTLGMPKDDRFQIITEHPRSGLQFDPDYLGIHRSEQCICLQITLNSGRGVETKQRFYKAVVDALHDELKLRREDVLINLIEVAKENWSFGNGIAQYT
jgi:4-oxalocrotonate tautomerase